MTPPPDNKYTDGAPHNDVAAKAKDAVSAVWDKAKAFAKTTGEKIGERKSADAPPPPSSYDVLTAYKSCLKRYITVSGRACRSEYWFWILANFLIGLLIGLIALISMMFIPFLPEVATLLFGLTALLAWAYPALIMLPGICVFARRMHDTGRSFWNILWALVPVIGPIILLIRLCEPSGPANIYGEGPNPPAI